MPGMRLMVRTLFAGVSGRFFSLVMMERQHQRHRQNHRQQQDCDGSPDVLDSLHRIAKIAKIFLSRFPLRETALYAPRMRTRPRSAVRKGLEWHKADEILEKEHQVPAFEEVDDWYVTIPQNPGYGPIPAWTSHPTRRWCWRFGIPSIIRRLSRWTNSGIRRSAGISPTGAPSPMI